MTSADLFVLHEGEWRRYVQAILDTPVAPDSGVRPHDIAVQKAACYLVGLAVGMARAGLPTALIADVLEERFGEYGRAVGTACDRTLPREENIH